MSRWRGFDQNRGVIGLWLEVEVVELWGEIEEQPSSLASSSFTALSRASPSVPESNNSATFLHLCLSFSPFLFTLRLLGLSFLVMGE